MNKRQKTGQFYMCLGQGRKTEYFKIYKNIKNTANSVGMRLSDSIGSTISLNIAIQFFCFSVLHPPAVFSILIFVWAVISGEG